MNNVDLYYLTSSTPYITDALALEIGMPELAELNAAERSQYLMDNPQIVQSILNLG